MGSDQVKPQRSDGPCIPAPSVLDILNLDCDGLLRLAVVFELAFNSVVCDYCLSKTFYSRYHYSGFHFVSTIGHRSHSLDVAVSSSTILTVSLNNCFLSISRNPKSVAEKKLENPIHSLKSNVGVILLWSYSFWEYSLMSVQIKLKLATSVKIFKMFCSRPRLIKTVDPALLNRGF